MARDSGSLIVGPNSSKILPAAKLDLFGDFRIRNTVSGGSSAVSVLKVNSNGTLMTGTEIPNSPAPNNSSSNVETNDVYMRSIGAWISQAEKIEVHLGYAKYHSIGGFWRSENNNYWGKGYNTYLTFSCPVVGGKPGIIIAAGGVSQDTNVLGNPLNQYYGVPMDYNSDHTSMYLRPGGKDLLGGPRVYYWYVCAPYNQQSITVVNHR